MFIAVSKAPTKNILSIIVVLKKEKKIESCKIGEGRKKRGRQKEETKAK